LAELLCNSLTAHRFQPNMPTRPPKTHICCLCIRVCVYDWPLPQELPPCFELPVHSGPVKALVVTPDDNFIFTCGEDGSVFVLGIKVMR